jgi:hypothetical protein
MSEKVRQSKQNRIYKRVALQRKCNLANEWMYGGADLGSDVEVRYYNLLTGCEASCYQGRTLFRK